MISWDNLFTKLLNYSSGIWILSEIVLLHVFTFAIYKYKNFVYYLHLKVVVYYLHLFIIYIGLLHTAVQVINYELTSLISDSLSLTQFLSCVEDSLGKSTA